MVIILEDAAVVKALYGCCFQVYMRFVKIIEQIHDPRFTIHIFNIKENICFQRLSAQTG